jgi:hypothetical protein
MSPRSSVLVAVLLCIAYAVPVRGGTFPTWDRIIPGPSRFKVLPQLGNAAVLDKETGLVWEKAPDTAGEAWIDAVRGCYGKIVGGRFGWRLPTIEELSTLVDPSQGEGGVSPPLPAGHPFENISAFNVFWSITTDQADDTFAQRMAIEVNAGLHGFTSAANKLQSNVRAWCVRGGHGIDGR